MKYRKWIPCVMLLLMAAALWGCFHGRGQRVWEDLQDSRMVFEQGLECSGAQYGEMNSGPALSVGGGTYTLEWDIETDAENRILIRTTNRASISPAEFVISPQQPQGSVRFTSLDEIYNLQIVVDYRAGSYIKVNRIDLIGHKNTDRLFTVTGILLLAAVLCALHASGWLTPDRRGALIVIAFAVCIASIPDLRGNLHKGHDSEFHMGRLLNLVNGLRSGQFPVRLGTYMQNGYGAIMSAYYPELFLYLPAVMIMLGASFTYSYHVFFILMHAASAVSMWYAAGRMLKSEKAGTAAAVLYTLSQYRLMDIYERFAIGESLAMCILPLFALGLYEVIFGDRRRWKLLAVSAALICQSHLISTAICGVLAVCIGALFCVRIVRESRIVPIVKAGVCALLLNVFFFAPLYTYSRQDVGTSWMARELSEAAISLAQLFVSPEYASAGKNAELAGYGIGVGLPMLLAAGAALYVLSVKRERGKIDWAVLALCIAGAGFALMSTDVFPWSRVSQITGGLVDYIQFPWRLLMLSSVCFAIAGGYAAVRLGHENEGMIQLAVLALCAVCALPMLSEEARSGDYLEAGELPYWDVRFGDYTLPGTNLRKLDVTDPIASQGVEVMEFKKYGSDVSVHISAEQDGSIVMPLYAFDGYAAELNGERLHIEQNETAHILLSVKKGMQGELKIWFEGKAYWKAADMLSLAALIGMILLTLNEKRRAFVRK